MKLNTDVTASHITLDEKKDCVMAILTHVSLSASPLPIPPHPNPYHLSNVTPSHAELAL